MNILYIMLAAIALGILVFVHELGHYIAAKRVGMQVDTFSIGFGKPILKWRWNDVDWQLGWLPFGGYVKIAGMEFGKKEKQTYQEPYETPNGFFSKTPLQRMWVAFAGPLASFLFAALLLTVIWAIGGREKPFSDFTHIVGWVEPGSDLYNQGLRPGDMITHYNGKPYLGAKDLLYATMLEGKQVELKGFHLDYQTGGKKPFSYLIQGYPASGAYEGILTTGITAPGRYLIYDTFSDGSPNPLPEGSPMADSGIAYHDRLVWADGEYIFSMDQLSHIINEGKSFLRVRRGNEVFYTRQPRLQAGDLALPSHVRNELIDWQYEMQAPLSMRRRVQDLYILPYVLNAEGYVEAPLDFIDIESLHHAFPAPLYSALERPLQAGDRILSIDGVLVDSGHQILELLQQHRVHLIVEKGVEASSRTSWRKGDQGFLGGLSSDIEHIAKKIGARHPVTTAGSCALLNPVTPKSIDQFLLNGETRQKLHEEYLSQKEEIDKIRDKDRRSQALKLLNQSHEKLLLGIYLQDHVVNYNPSPLTLFGSVFTETWQTLKALVVGRLNPKWLSGPIGIVQVIHHGWQVGLREALFWVSAISINLGVLNLLPIPVLDGGYIFLSFWELITHRRLKAKTMVKLIIPFVVLLIGLLVFLTFQDIARIF